MENHITKKKFTECVERGCSSVLQKKCTMQWTRATKAQNTR